MSIFHRRYNILKIFAITFFVCQGTMLEKKLNVDNKARNHIEKCELRILLFD